jgi:hypothetical protein
VAQVDVTLIAGSPACTRAVTYDPSGADCTAAGRLAPVPIGASRVFLALSNPTTRP